MIRHIASLWSLTHYPLKGKEWTLDEKVAAAKKAGFAGVASGANAGLPPVLQKHGLLVTGYISSGRAAEFPALIKANKDMGAQHINVQLADDDTPTAEALGLTVLLLQEGKKQGVEPAIEVHRDTCTETPEKTYALADAYQKVTGELLPMTWDFSHLAVVKHLAPSNYIERLITRPDLIQRAQQFHFRPFNGHHCQVPVTDGKGNLTPEVQDWLPFAEAVLKCWLDGRGNNDRDIFVCPEMGPVPGYNLSTLPNSWEDTTVLRVEIENIWKKLTTR
jgi:sugar phosphate isomerase/epimerase